ncbi:hypothetical protein LPJ64_001000 [Coemansia asiatica]|uniref:SWIRM domain-containing protein n=1 Tax=Coemansia asiatica TaxID=1052880 RepID=A0A9W7XRG8_9FUNG|nr:hypothetical protein LPJ64_001000 [Coemansia asiatica]KAJ2873363.1 hypothetical protein FB639_004221 [Coemansia asiatica]
MSPTAVQQTFWDRVPNATSKLAMLAKGNRSQRLREQQTRRIAQNGCEAIDVSAARVNKRKQSRPMRSPLSPTDANAGSQAEVGSYPAGANKARRLSFDTCDSQNPTLHIGTRNLSRAFRMSFSDEYLRNPQEYVQALIDCESALPVLALSASRSQNSSRIRGGTGAARSAAAGRHREHYGGSNGAKTAARQSGSRRIKQARFHNLQLEQTLSAAQSENEDTNSVTTAASDINDLADMDSQVPGTPVGNLHRLAAKAEMGTETETEAEAEAEAEPDTGAATVSDCPDISKPQTPHLLSSSSLSNTKETNIETSHGSNQIPSSLSLVSGVRAEDIDQSEQAEEDAGNSESMADTPASAQSSAASPPLSLRDLGEDNIPSYERMGQAYAGDVTLIKPPNVKSTVKWTKAEPIDINDRPLADKLAAAERHCCSVLRILPEQYIAIKQTLLREGRSRQPGTFKKRDAQRLCRIDVNKTSKIYEWFVNIGWLPAGNGIYNALPQ